MTTNRPLRVFLCHSNNDKIVVRELYQRLLSEGWIDPWLDEEKLLPGQDWDMEIEKAVESADVVLACLSNNSVTKEGYIQRELKFVLDIALEKPEGTIFVVPLRLDDCTMPRRLRTWQYVDYFPASQQKRAYQRLLQSLDVRRAQLNIDVNTGKKAQAQLTATPAQEVEEKMPLAAGTFAKPTITSPAPMGVLDLVGTVLPIIYFISAGLDVLDISSTTPEMIVLAASAMLTSFFLFFKRQTIPGLPMKVSLMIFLLAQSVVFYSDSYGADIAFIPSIVAGLAALTVAGLLVINIRTPKKPALYSSIMLGVFLLLVGIKLFFNIFSAYPSDIYTFMILSAVITSITLWLDQ